MTSHEGNYEIHSAYKSNEFSLYQYFKHPSSVQLLFPGFDHECRRKNILNCSYERKSVFSQSEMLEILAKRWLKR